MSVGMHCLIDSRLQLFEIHIQRASDARTSMMLTVSTSMSIVLGCLRFSLTSHITSPYPWLILFSMHYRYVEVQRDQCNKASLALDDALRKINDRVQQMIAHVDGLLTKGTFWLATVCTHPSFSSTCYRVVVL